MLSIFLFTGLWTSLARMQFNEVSLEKNLHGPRGLMELLLSYNGLFLCRCVCESQTLSVRLLLQSKKQIFKVNLRDESVWARNLPR